MHKNFLTKLCLFLSGQQSSVIWLCHDETQFISHTISFRIIDIAYHIAHLFLPSIKHCIVGGKRVSDFWLWNFHFLSSHLCPWWSASKSFDFVAFQKDFADDKLVKKIFFCSKLDSLAAFLNGSEPLREWCLIPPLSTDSLQKFT